MCHYLYSETQEELEALVVQQEGPDYLTKFVRSQGAGDGAYLTRSYHNQSRSAHSEYMIICSQTGLLLWWGYRQNSCSQCNRSKRTGVYWEHKCKWNFDGSVGDMEVSQALVGAPLKI